MDDLDRALASLDASRAGVYVFTSVKEVPEGVHPFAQIHEDEGTTLILPEQEARDAGLPRDERYARITLGAYTTLNSVGLTATIAQTLASRSISCNVIAGYYHDHLFVPADRVNEALALLRDLARQAQGWMPQAPTQRA